MKTKPVHKSVQKKTGPGQIASILEKPHQEKKRNKIRENDSYSTANPLHQSDQ